MYGWLKQHKRSQTLQPLLPPCKGLAVPELLVQACRRDPNSLVQAAATQALLPERSTSKENFSSDVEIGVITLCGGSSFTVQATVYASVRCALAYARRHKSRIERGLRLYDGEKL